MFEVYSVLNNTGESIATTVIVADGYKDSIKDFLREREVYLFNLLFQKYNE